MANDKRIVVCLPQELLDEFDGILDCKSNRNRSKFIREAVILYIKEQRKKRLTEQMKKGYAEMASLNRDIAEYGFVCDCKELSVYEASLLESDLLDDTNSKEGRYLLCRSESCYRL